MTPKNVESIESLGEGEDAEYHVDEALERMAEAILLLKLLETSSFFETLPIKNWEVAPADAQSKELDRLFIGHLIFFHLKTMSGQVFEIPCKIVKKNQFAEAATVTLGFGLFPRLTFINHSCFSNLHVSTAANGEVVARIVYPVKDNQELTISYGDIGWDFACECQACTENWPLAWDMNQDLELCCPSCTTPLPTEEVIDRVTTGNTCICPTCEHDQTQVLLELADEFLSTDNKLSSSTALFPIPKSYQKSYKLLFVSGRPEAAAHMMESFLTKFSSLFKMPSYPITLATTHLFNCYNFMHNNVFFDD
ncbi:unnamed protein product [Notodromas monacha]|nr:unnamed protein product [Notodromas monacha]CAG0925450.1 unnamed protein product [Notodromas monacha]